MPTTATTYAYDASNSHPEHLNTARFVVDSTASDCGQSRFSLQYAPALKMFVSFKVRNNRTGFEQSCELASLKAP